MPLAIPPAVTAASAFFLLESDAALSGALLRVVRGGFEVAPDFASHHSECERARCEINPWQHVFVKGREYLWHVILLKACVGKKHNCAGDCVVEMVQIDHDRIFAILAA